jgi:phosphatidylglycerophosphatase A
VLLVGIVVSGALTVWLGDWLSIHWGRKDPGAFVLDEVAGICLTLLLIPLRAGWHEAVVLLVGFGAFRVFDIVKLWPCKKLEGLPGGWGVLADDLMAAVYANLLGQFLLRFVA